MTWSDVFPILSDELFDEYLADAPKKFRREAAEWFAEQRTINPRPTRHIVSVSLFWKNLRSHQPDIVIRDRADFMAAGKSRKLLRFEPWSTYVRPVLEGAYRLHAARKDVAFRVYLAADMAFLVEDLVAAGCEVRLMKSSSIRHNPGAMWRFLALAETDRLVTIVDADRAAHAEPDILRTEVMAQSGLKWWRVPTWGELNEVGTVCYRPFLALQFGSMGGLTEVRKMMEALAWASQTGRIETFAKLPGCAPRQIHGVMWPDYGFDEWFMLSGVYPRAAYDGVLTFVPSDAKSRLLTLDVQYATQANNRAEIHYFGPTEAGCCGTTLDAAEKPGAVTMREHCEAAFWQEILEGRKWQVSTRWIAVVSDGIEPLPSGAEVFLDRRMDGCDVAHSGFAFALVTAEVAAWAKRLKLTPGRWQVGQPLRYPKLKGPMVLWRAAFLHQLLAAWRKGGEAVKVEFFLAAWMELGKAIVMNQSSVAQGWKKRAGWRAPEVPRIAEERWLTVDKSDQGIPKRLIITYISKAALNPLMRMCVDRMETLHPDWEIQFFSDGDCEEFVRQQGEGYADLYRWIPRAVMRADFFRVLAVHILGGFYLDADVLLTAALDPLCKHEAVFPWEQHMDDHHFALRFPKATRQGEKHWMVGQYAFGATAGHPFTGCILEEMVKRTASFEVDRCTDLDVLHATGPDLVTTCYYREPKRWKTLTLLHGEANAEAGESPVFGASRQQRFGRYGRHLVNSGWREK